jgi:hypothetical protein
MCSSLPIHRPDVCELHHFRQGIRTSVAPTAVTVENGVVTRIEEQSAP